MDNLAIAFNYQRIVITFCLFYQPFMSQSKAFHYPCCYVFFFSYHFHT